MKTLTINEIVRAHRHLAAVEHCRWDMTPEQRTIDHLMRVSAPLDWNHDCLEAIERIDYHVNKCNNAQLCEY